MESQILPFFNNLQVKNLRDWSIPSKDLDDQKILQSDKRRNWPHPTKDDSPRYCHHLITNSMQNNSLDSYQNNDYQKNLQSQWTRGTSGHTKIKVVASDAPFAWWLTPCKKKLRYYFTLFRYTDDKKKPWNLIWQKAQMATHNQKW